MALSLKKGPGSRAECVRILPVITKKVLGKLSDCESFVFTEQFRNSDTPTSKAGAEFPRAVRESRFPAWMCEAELRLLTYNTDICLVRHIARSPAGAVPFTTVKSVAADSETTLGQTGPVRTLGSFLA